VSVPASIWCREKKPARLRVLDVLADLQWHRCTELMRVGGNRYAGRIDELRVEGYQIDAEPLPNRAGGKRYRLRSVVPGRRREKRVRVYLSPADAKALLRGEITLFARQAVQEALHGRPRTRE